MQPEHFVADVGSFVPQYGQSFVAGAAGGTQIPRKSANQTMPTIPIANGKSGISKVRYPSRNELDKSQERDCETRWHFGLPKKSGDGLWSRDGVE